MIKKSEVYEIFSSLKSELEKIGKINDDNIEKEFLELSSEYSYWLSKLVEAKKTFEEAKRQFELTEAELYNEIRKKTDNKITETGIRNALKLVPEWKETNSKLVEAEMFVTLFNLFIKALDKKSEMLVSFASWKKKEMEKIK
jgi:hypothetical protein